MPLTPESIAEQFIQDPLAFAVKLLELRDIAESMVGEHEQLVSMIHQLQRQNHALQQQKDTLQRQLWERDRTLMELNELASHYKFLTVH